MVELRKTRESEVKMYQVKKTIKAEIHQYYGNPNLQPVGNLKLNNCSRLTKSQIRHCKKCAISGASCYLVIAGRKYDYDNTGRLFRL